MKTKLLLVIGLSLLREGEATKSQTATTDTIAFDILREVTRYVTPATPINF